jgi:hypothetical protein
MDSPSEPTPLRDVSGPAERQPTNADLLEQLRQDRLWLLRQLDSGRWPQWRLDLAALERELGHLLDQAAEGLPRS